jgi:hypothetical protein
VLDLGWRDGKRTRKYFYGRTRDQVARKLARGLARHHQGYEFANEQLTVEQFLARWLEAKQGTVTSGTWRWTFPWEVDTGVMRPWLMVAG